MKTLIRLTAAVLLLAPALLRAAVSPEEAARLGAELTPLGGEKAGNADGSIPAWTGGLESAAEAGFPNYHPGDHYPDPYANDKPLLTINSANLTQYASKLTEGQDRKSTRLNSSHVAISYAVFCLKKKQLRLALSSVTRELRRCCPPIYSRRGSGRARVRIAV